MPLKFDPIRLAVVGLLGATLVYACASTSTPIGEAILIPWRPGNAAAFQSGAAEERGKKAANGSLPVNIYRPDGAGPFPFIVLLHGCGGLHREAMWSAWVEPWADVFRAHGVGTAVVDSFGPRRVDQVCTGNVAAWAMRRADDAYSVRSWLAEQPYVDATRIAVMGMSNGGRTVLAALRVALKHPSICRGCRALSGLSKRCRQRILRAVAGAHRQRRHGDAGSFLRGDEAGSTGVRA